MTDPEDETQPHPTVGGSADRAIGLDAPATGAGQPLVPGPGPGTAPSGPAPSGSAPAAAVSGPVASPVAAPGRGDPARVDGAPGASRAPGLQADPDRPADSGWREPAWFPPRRPERRSSAVAIAFG